MHNDNLPRKVKFFILANYVISFTAHWLETNFPFINRHIVDTWQWPLLLHFEQSARYALVATTAACLIGWLPLQYFILTEHKLPEASQRLLKIKKQRYTIGTLILFCWWLALSMAAGFENESNLLKRVSKNPYLTSFFVSSYFVSLSYLSAATKHFIHYTINARSQK